MRQLRKIYTCCNDAVEKDPFSFKFVSVHLRTNKMYRAFGKYLHPMKDKTQDMCNEDVEKTHVNRYMSLITLKPKRCVKKP